MLPTSLWWRSIPIPTLRATSSSRSIIVPETLRHRPTGPPLLHRRTAGTDTFGTTTPPDAAAQNSEEDETAHPASDADDEFLVVVDPGADFFGGGGAFALALEIAYQWRTGHDNTCYGEEK